jgi:hypothetical protein
MLGWISPGGGRAESRLTSAILRRQPKLWAACQRLTNGVAPPNVRTALSMGLPGVLTPSAAPL